MVETSNHLDIVDLDIMLDDLLASEHQQSNCMFQLALMLARIALSPVSDNFKDQAAHTLLGLVRAKRKNDDPIAADHAAKALRPTGGLQLQRFAAANLDLRR